MTHLSWEEVYDRVKKRIPKGVTCYGIPRGGAIVAGLTNNAVDHPDHAKVLVDDIIDSGKTRDAWEKQTGLRLAAIVDKARHEDRDLGWVVFPWEEGVEEGPEDAIVRLLEFVGENPTREGLVDTPGRVIRAWEEMSVGYREDPAKILSKVFRSPEADQLILVRNIQFESTCEHHLLPFMGEAHVGYIPLNGKVVGLSKIPRLVRCFAKRLQIQEGLTSQIANAFQKHVEPLGVGVIVKAYHLCVRCRGVKDPKAEMVTSCLLGVIREHARNEFLNLIGI